MIPFKDIYHLEKSTKNDPDAVHTSDNTLSATPLQSQVVDIVTIDLLADDDHRVRQAAASCLVRLVESLFLNCDYPDGDAVTAIAVEQCAANMPTFAAAGYSVSSNGAYHRAFSRVS